MDPAKEGGFPRAEGAGGTLAALVHVPRVRIGPAGWSYPDWEGRVYPRPHPRGFHPLAFLARYVDCVEINMTFYRTPAPEHAARWARAVEDRPDFRFLAKIGGEFTHGRWSDAPVQAARVFRASLEPLREGGKLSALLAQFPFFFRFDDAGRDRLARIAHLFGGLPVVAELRNRSWFTEEGYAFLARHGLGLAHIDLPDARDHPPHEHACVGEIGYVRLHGRNAGSWFDKNAGRDDKYDYLYSRDELAGVVERLKDVAGQSRETFLVTNNHYGGQALANALEIRGMLDDTRPQAPPTLREAFPHLANLTRHEGQQTLF